MSQKLILLVEDDINLRNSISLILQRAGHLITATDCANEAMNILQSGKYQLLISDIDMPETRYALLPYVLGKYPQLPIIILTDHSIPENGSKGNPRRPHYLAKPVDPAFILSCVTTLIGSKPGSQFVQS